MENTVILIILFLFSSLAFGGIAKRINQITSFPYTPMLFVTGLLAGVYSNHLG